MIGEGGGGVVHVAGFWRAGGVGGGSGIFQAVWVAVLRGTARHKRGGGVCGGRASMRLYY